MGTQRPYSPASYIAPAPDSASLARMPGENASLSRILPWMKIRIHIAKRKQIASSPSATGTGYCGSSRRALWIRRSVA
jgi:hypothetical protein